MSGYSVICKAVQDLAYNVKTVVKVHNYEEKEMLIDLGLSHITVETQETALSMYEEIKKCEITK